jgi:phosphinothricin acetyltransferase
MLLIYGQVVQETAISWEYEVPTISDFENRLAKILIGGHPWIVLEDDSGELAGYSYAGNYRDRYGYGFCCETSIYMRADVRGRGLGKELYTTLLEILTRQGFVAAIAGVSYPNAASEALHRSLGFEMVGIHQEIGYKFGTWHSACFMQKELAPRGEPIGETPIRFYDLLSRGQLADLVSSQGL